MRHGGNCSRCGGSRRSGSIRGRRRLGVIGHVFSVAFLLFIVGWGVEEVRGTEVVRETFDVENALAKVTGLFVLGTTI